jgi:hypothetical protein
MIGFPLMHAANMNLIWSMKCQPSLRIASNYLAATEMEVTLQFMQCMPSAIQAVAVTGYAASAARFHSMAEQLSLQYISVPKSLVSNLHAMTYRTYVIQVQDTHTIVTSTV